MFEDDVKLLTVVSLAKDGRVKCQHPGCTRTVYKRVHVISVDEAITFVGSTCFKKLYGDFDLQPLYGNSEGTILSQEERDLILSNTEQFLLSLQSQHMGDCEVKIDTPSLTPEKPTPRKIMRATGIHVYTCFRCSSDRDLYKFESVERTCPKCKRRDEVFTVK